MSSYIVKQDEVTGWIFGLSSNQTVLFPKKHGEKSFRFERVERNSDIQFEKYAPTILPPVKVLFPERDELLRFGETEGGRMAARSFVDDSHRILAGVRPCDLKGIFLMDLFFEEGVADQHYLSRRQNTDIIAYACPNPCDDRSFCAAVDSLDHQEGADILLTPLDGKDLLVEVLTIRGEDLVGEQEWQVCEESAARRVGAVASRPESFGRLFNVGATDLPGEVRRHWDTPVWKKHVERCFSCGTCNLVCPTCYCFDVHDELNLDASSGTRVRTWDGCMLPHFAGVAGGHNFRAESLSRQRHRVKRKFEYLPDRFGHGIVCVGCGRCGRQCTSHIDIFEIVTDLIASGGRS